MSEEKFSLIRCVCVREKDTNSEKIVIILEGKKIN